MNVETDNINPFIEETEFWKTTSIAQTGVLGAIGAWFLKISARFLKNKNNSLNNLERRVSAIEAAMIVTKSDGNKVSLSNYVQNDVKHALDNNEKGIAGFMEMLMQERDLQARINQQILIKLNQINKNDIKDI